uniref:Myb-like domain-containing protein n=1 Tax=Oryza punctata TaxID=4537 RepID=A0A0E0JT23_ORYPU
MAADKSQAGGLLDACRSIEVRESAAAAAMSGAGNASSPAAAAGTGTPRSRLPRWTRHETLVLLQARRAMEHRGRRSPQPVRLKWAVVSAYCRRHGVERGPMQCRKRWGNLSWDLKKIVAWEKNLAAVVLGAGDNAVAGEGEPGAEAPRRLESFWDMRGEQRRARQLPSSFDREVYDALVGCHDAAPPSDFGEDLADGDDAEADELPPPPPPPPLMVMPISATVSAKRGGAASDKNSTSQHDGGGLKDSEATYGAGVGAEEGTTTATATATTTSIGRQVIEALERGNRMLGDQLEAQRAIWDAEREQRAALLAAVDKLAGAVCRIADKL